LDAIEVDELVAAVENAPTKKVVLWFRSPGGITTGIPEAAAALRQSSKQVVAFTDDLCASAAYWLAAQCAGIHSTGTARLGSIGVYIAFYDFCGYLEQQGIKLELFKAGLHKAMGVPGNPLSEQDSGLLQARVDDSYRRFCEEVTMNREIDKASMQGQTFEGEDAKRAHLTDKLWHGAPSFFASL
jgi:signal peptide peptidase SppA